VNPVLGLLEYSEERGSRFLRNTRTSLPQCIASQPRKLYFPNIWYFSHGDSLSCTCLFQLNFPRYVTCHRLVNTFMYIPYDTIVDITVKILEVACVCLYCNIHKYKNYKEKARTVDRRHFGQSCHKILLSLSLNLFFSFILLGIWCVMAIQGSGKLFTKCNKL